MRCRHSDRAHFMQDNGHAGAGDLPGGLRTGEAAADDVDRFQFAHARAVGFGAMVVLWKATICQRPSCFASIMVGRAWLSCISSSMRAWRSAVAIAFGGSRLIS